MLFRTKNVCFSLTHITDHGSGLRQADEQSYIEKNEELSDHGDNIVDKNVFVKERLSELQGESEKMELQSNVYRQDHLNTFNVCILINVELFLLKSEEFGIYLLKL